MMATTSNVQVTISLSELSLDEEELQTEVENLLPQIKEVDGVEDADLVAVTEAIQGSKSFGGFELGALKAVINPALIKPLFEFLGRVLGNKSIKVGIKAPDGRELNLEASSREDLEFAQKLAEDFLKKTNIERIGQEQERAKYEKQQAEFKKKRERELSEAVSQPPSPPGIQTQSFEFDTATINVKSGKTCEINRSRKRAEFFSENLGNNVVLEMVAIPGGKFLMGSLENELGRSDDESPQHTVTVQPFFMGKFPVTQSQWAVVAALKKVNIDLDAEPSKFKGNNRPVEQVSWDDAIEFCARLSNKTGKTYRLPSEAEWEYACRAGTTTPFYFGETITTDLANYRGTDWDYQGTLYPGNYGQGPKGEYRQQTTDVRKFPPNTFGLFDMHGNICEWCQDAWHKNYNGAPADGSPWMNESHLRLLRGGCWYNVPEYCRSDSRLKYSGISWDERVGFRVVIAATVRN